MPIYTYRCESCGVQFERHQSFTDEPLKRCPECNKNSLRKVLTTPGIVFKGSGWYATDHKSPSGQARMGKADGKDSTSSGSSSSESSGSSESSTKSESSSDSGSSSKNESAGSKTESPKKSAE